MKAVFTLTALSSFAIMGAALMIATAPARADQITAPDMPITFMECQDLRMIPDAGISVILRSGGFVYQQSAVVEQESIAGPREVGTYFVREERPAPGVMGGQVRYVAPGFELSVGIGTAPLPGGRIYATLRMGREMDVVREMSCRYLKVTL